MHIEKDWVCVPCNSHCPQAIFLKGVKPPPLKTKQKPPIWGKNTNTNRPLSHCFSNVKVQALVRSIHDLVFHYVLFYPDILLQHFVWESLTAALFFSMTIRCFLDGIAWWIKIQWYLYDITGWNAAPSHDRASAVFYRCPYTLVYLLCTYWKTFDPNIL